MRTCILVALCTVIALSACSKDARPAQAARTSPPDATIVFIEDGAVDKDAAWSAGASDAGDAQTENGMPTSDGLDDLVRLALHFDIRVADRSISCGPTFGPVGTEPSRVEFHDARFFVHDVMMIGDDGVGHPATLASDGAYHNGDVALLDFENSDGNCASGDATENHIVRVGVNPGNYVGVAFRVGVPERLNHNDPTLASPPLDQMGMHWSWADGYKFLRLDAQTEAGISFGIHLGSTQCTVDSTDKTVCAQENRPQVVFKSFDPSKQQIVLHYDVLVSDMNSAGSHVWGAPSGTRAHWRREPSARLPAQRA